MSRKCATSPSKANSTGQGSLMRVQIAMWHSVETRRYPSPGQPPLNSQLQLQRATPERKREDKEIEVGGENNGRGRDERIVWGGRILLIKRSTFSCIPDVPKSPTYNLGESFELVPRLFRSKKALGERFSLAICKSDGEFIDGSVNLGGVLQLRMKCPCFLSHLPLKDFSINLDKIQTVRLRSELHRGTESGAMFRMSEHFIDATCAKFGATEKQVHAETPSLTLGESGQPSGGAQITYQANKGNVEDWQSCGVTGSKGGEVLNI
ncbi:hypothetical protein Tco_0276953 [Tanacetum coccineum]